MAAVYKIGKKWRADWTDNEGIRHRTRFDTKGEADAALTEIRAQLNAGTYVAPKKIPTFGAWLIHGSPDGSSNHGHPAPVIDPLAWAQWQTHVAHMKTSFDLVKASDIGAGAIERAIAKWRLPKKEDGRELSVQTIAKVLTTMSRIFKFGMRNRCGIQADPTKLIEKVKESSGEQSETGERLYNVLHEVTEQEVLTPEEAKRVIMAAAPGRFRTIIQTGIFTGARVSELLALRWEHVNFEKGIVEIRRSMSTAKVKGEATQEKVRWFDPKTKQGKREIPIPPQLVATLKEWKEKCPQSRLGLVFCNEFGEPCDRTGIGR